MSETKLFWGSQINDIPTELHGTKFKISNDKNHLIHLGSGIYSPIKNHVIQLLIERTFKVKCEPILKALEMKRKSIWENQFAELR